MLLRGEYGAREGAVVEGTGDCPWPSVWLHPLDTVTGVLRGKYLRGARMIGSNSINTVN